MYWFDLCIYFIYDPQNKQDSKNYQNEHPNHKKCFEQFGQSVLRVNWVIGKKPTLLISSSPSNTTVTKTNVKIIKFSITIWTKPTTKYTCSIKFWIHSPITLRQKYDSTIKFKLWIRGTIKRRMIKTSFTANNGAVYFIHSDGSRYEPHSINIVTLRTDGKEAKCNDHKKRTSLKLTLDHYKTHDTFAWS